MSVAANPRGKISFKNSYLPISHGFVSIDRFGCFHHRLYNYGLYSQEGCGRKVRMEGQCSCPSHLAVLALALLA